MTIVEFLVATAIALVTCTLACTLIHALLYLLHGRYFDAGE